MVKDLKKIYFLGIGGIGMSALARFFHRRGAEIYGYDRTETALTKKLVNEGMKIHYTEDTTQIPSGIDLVIYTPAIPKTNSELHFLKKINCQIKKRAEVLGMISRTHRTIAVAGTHGKTTTSSLLTHILRVGGVDCTAFLGGIPKNYLSNYVEGNSDWVVVEADEYDRSFLHLHPDIAILTSMDADHLDIYGDVKTMHESGFRAFVQNLKPGGHWYLQHQLTENFDDFSPSGRPRTYGVDGGEIRAENVRVESGWFVFDIKRQTESARGTIIPDVRLSLPGRHNVENATAAAAVALQLGVSPEDIRRALASFEGIERRFEWVHRDARTALINDYAHHPTELNAAIGAARELFPDRKLTGIFQPHLYTRTRDFQVGFAKALDALDEVVLMDIYPAREAPLPGITSRVILDKMQNPNKVLASKDNLINVLKDKDLEVVLMLGAGDIDTLVEPVKELLLNQ